MKSLALRIALTSLLGPIVAVAQDSPGSAAATRAGTFTLRGTEVAVELGEFAVQASRAATNPRVKRAGAGGGDAECGGVGDRGGVA